VQIEQLLQACFGIEDAGENIKLYVAGPNAGPPGRNERGVRTGLFHLFGGEEADAIRRYLASHPAWEFLRVSPTPSGGGRRQPRGP
jgi:hypothetical protein